MPWVGGEGATGTWLQRSRGRRQNSQAVIGGQAVTEEGTVLVFHLCKPGGKRAGLRHKRHPETFRGTLNVCSVHPKCSSPLRPLCKTPWQPHSVLGSACPQTPLPTAPGSARCHYLLAKCSIREWVSACGSIGEEAGLQETHTGQRELRSSPKTRAWRGCPARPRLAARLKSAPPNTRCCQP